MRPDDLESKLIRAYVQTCQLAIKKHQILFYVTAVRTHDFESKLITSKHAD